MPTPSFCHKVFSFDVKTESAHLPEKCSVGTLQPAYTRRDSCLGHLSNQSTLYISGTLSQLLHYFNILVHWSEAALQHFHGCKTESLNQTSSGLLPFELPYFGSIMDDFPVLKTPLYKSTTSWWFDVDFVPTSFMQFILINSVWWYFLRSSYASGTTPSFVHSYHHQLQPFFLQ